MDVKVILQRSVNINKVELDKPIINYENLNNYILEHSNKLYMVKDMLSGTKVILNDGLETSLLRCRNFFGNNNIEKIRHLGNNNGALISTDDESYIYFNEKFKGDIDVDENVVEFMFNYGSDLSPEKEEVRIEMKGVLQHTIKHLGKTLMFFY